MKIRELEKQLADVGLELHLYIGDRHYYYVDDSDDNRYAYIDKNGRFVIDTDTDWFKALPTKKRKHLFNLLMEFAATPLNKRQSAKCYVNIEYRGFFGNDRTFWVSEYDVSTEDYELSSKRQDAGKFDEEVADKIIGMLSDTPIIKKTKVAVN